MGDPGAWLSDPCLVAVPGTMSVGLGGRCLLACYQNDGLRMDGLCKGDVQRRQPAPSFAHLTCTGPSQAHLGYQLLLPAHPASAARPAVWAADC